MTEERGKIKQRRSGGRPTCFREIYTEQVYKLTLLGAIDRDLADFFGVCERTINYWKRRFPEFLQSLKRGKILADAEVAEQLYHRAIGYSHPETRVFCQRGEIIECVVTKYYPPDTGAAIIWLKNRQGLHWRGDHDSTSDGEKITPQIVAFSDVANTPKPVEDQQT